MKPIHETVLALMRVLPTAGCSDEVRTRSKDLPQARVRGACDRGRLSPLLQGSATNIARNDHLDLNTGTGTFAYDPSERTSYLKCLMQIEVVGYCNATPDVTILKTNGFQRQIELYGYTGKERYKVSPL